MNIIKKIKYHYKIFSLTRQLLNFKKLERESILNCDYVKSAKYRDKKNNVQNKIENLYDEYIKKIHIN